MSNIPNPGTGFRLLVPSEIITSEDEWTFSPGGIGWGKARKDDHGKTLREARLNSTHGNNMYYKRKIDTLVLCGCGNHQVDSLADPYEQHRKWATDKGID